MQGRSLIGVGALTACAVASCFVLPSISNGLDDRRGGNHGCNPIDGFIYSDAFHEPGDNVSFGFQVEDGGSFPRRGTTHELRSRNTPSGGGTSESLTCSAAPGVYNSVRSDLGSGDDSIRLDAKDIPPDGEGGYQPIPKEFDSLLVGGGGADKIRGHRGFDNISGGSGPDVIKADDGKKDKIKCGSGEDKADVDSKDVVSGCEKKT